MQNEINYYNKHIPEANGLMVKFRREGFYVLYIKLAKLTSETSLNQRVIPV